MKNFLDNQVKDKIGVTLAKHGLTVESVFIPWSLSRNAGEKNPSLNWKVTLKQNGRKILTTDYMAGCAHAPSYKQSFKRDPENERLVLAECENGGKARYMATMDYIAVPQSSKGTLKPESRDVIHSLLLDSEVLDYPSFEDWAGNFGYEEDSRQAERIYNDCMKIALQFRRIGESVIEELREVFQDY